MKLDILTDVDCGVVPAQLAEHFGAAKLQRTLPHSRETSEKCPEHHKKAHKQLPVARLFILDRNAAADTSPVRHYLDYLFEQPRLHGRVGVQKNQYIACGRKRAGVTHLCD